jgi:hypothetical protein
MVRGRIGFSLNRSKKKSTKKQSNKKQKNCFLVVKIARLIGGQQFQKRKVTIKKYVDKLALKIVQKYRL